MSAADWSLIEHLSSSIDQCESVEFMPLTSNDDYIVHCHCEENLYLCLNLTEIRSMVRLCYSLLFSLKNQLSKDLSKVTRVLLCYVTECSTSWNLRRRLLLAKETTIDDELNFSAKLLRLKPKSEQMFRYRRWLIKQSEKTSISIDKELTLCDRTAEKHFINYTSWQYRRWLVEYFQLNINDELDRNRRWLDLNLSDSSGFSFRSFLLSKSDDQQSLIERELRSNEDKLRFFIDRESLWIYRQTLIFLLMKFFGLDQQTLFERELMLIKTFPSHLFSNRYFRLISTLSSTRGAKVRDENE